MVSANNGVIEVFNWIVLVLMILSIVGAFCTIVVFTNEGLCIFIAICVHYYFLANFLWTFCIAFNFYQMIVRRNREHEQLEKYYHVACWGIPAIFVIFAGGF